jgi:hypothetical protein
MTNHLKRDRVDFVVSGVVHRRKLLMEAELMPGNFAILSSNQKVVKQVICSARRLVPQRNNKFPAAGLSGALARAA